MGDGRWRSPGDASSVTHYFRIVKLLDYLFRGQTELLVIEAKRQDLDYGMIQLVAEMIALDQWDRTPEQKTLLGAVTTGKLWEFALRLVF